MNMFWDFLHRVRWAATAIVVLTPVCHQAEAASTNTPWRQLTQSQLTAVWWKWLYSVPATQNGQPYSPFIDITGANAYNGQPYSDLVFLGGTFTFAFPGTGDVLGQATRRIEVNPSAAIFFPIVNAEFDNTGCTPHLPTPGAPCLYNLSSHPVGFPQLQALVTTDIDTASDRYAKLQPADANFVATGPGEDIQIVRLKSPPFSYSLPANTPTVENLYKYLGYPDVSGTIAPAAGDGYFSFVPGGKLNSNQRYYLLTFGGRLRLNPFDQTSTSVFIEDITYKITVK